MEKRQTLEELFAQDPEVKCQICHERLFENTGKTTSNICNLQGIGNTHDHCAWPYIPEKEIRVLFQIRCYSIGDTIATTPALRELRRRYPVAHISVMTVFPELFEYNPYVNSIFDLNGKTNAEVAAHANTCHFKLDAFSGQGQHFAVHSVEYSTQSAFSASIYPTEWNYDVFYNEEIWKSAKRIAGENGINPDLDRCIVLHPHGTEWVTRDWGPARMHELAERLRRRFPDHKIVSIGGKRDTAKNREMKNYVELSGAIDLYGKMSLLESAAFLDQPCVKLLVTPDTGTLHLGGSRPELPIVGIFTLVKAHFRTPVRHRKYGYKFIAVEADNPCNCTYFNRVLTVAARFDKCPKREFIERTLRFNLPKPAKLDGLRGLMPEFEWSPDKLGAQLRDRAKLFQYGDLPCFPATDKVFAACVQAMERWGT